eukprot:scaffold2775_cov343-Prasinococcus_capsulatus_cf.AAC.12
MVPCPPRSAGPVPRPANRWGRSCRRSNARARARAGGVQNFGTRARGHAPKEGAASASPRAVAVQKAARAPPRRASCCVEVGPAGETARGGGVAPTGDRSAARHARELEPRSPAVSVAVGVQFIG